MISFIVIFLILRILLRNQCFYGDTMKKSLYAVLVIILGSIGATALAAKLDVSVHKITVQETNQTSTTNDGNRKCAKMSER
jgi:hypothetical protein